MKRAIMLGTLAIALATAGLEAQGRNFAGTWVIDSEKTQAAGGGAIGSREVRIGGDATTAAGGGGGGSRAIAGTGVVTRSAGAGGESRATATPGMTLTLDATTFAIVNGGNTTAYKLDGSLATIETPRGKIMAKASWQGDKIAIETTSEGPTGPIVTHATWYLEGESLVRENKSTTADGQAIVRKTYYNRS
jgi:hypothetical protein